MQYISENEHTKRIKIVFVSNEYNILPKKLPDEIDFLDREYPEIDIEFITEDGSFSPQYVQGLSQKWNIPINFMFIGSPGDKFPYKIEDFGGVRLII